MTIIEDMQKIHDRVVDQIALMVNEDSAIALSVLPFIQALGYDNYNLHEVRPEFRADARTSGHERVDYAIMSDGEPIILV